MKHRPLPKTIAAVQVGLYTAFRAMRIYAVFVTSRPLSASISTTSSILAAAQHSSKRFLLLLFYLCP